MTTADDTVVAVDLFCGAGGFSEGLRQACEDLGYDLRHAAVNHDEKAVETHSQNHEQAHQYQSKVEQLHPPDVVRDLTDGESVDVDLLVGGPSCTHFSKARGGKPVKEQLRMSPWSVLTWLEMLNVDTFVIENVSEIQQWGPVDDEGQPTRDGSIFEAWVNALNSLGYAVDWTELVAADYGDPTSRKRFFIVGRKHDSPTFPEPTHSDEDPELPDHRTAADIIDWSDLGSSIWTRDITEPRVHSPPKDTTLDRIAEGIRRHCNDALEPFADALAEMDRDKIRDLRNNRAIPAEHADAAALALDEPFLVQYAGESQSSETSLVKYYGTSPPQPVDEPIDTVTANGQKYTVSTAESIILKQQDWGHPWAVRERPAPTVTTRGAHALVTPSLIEPKNGRHRGVHSNPLYPAGDRPAHTITTDPRAKLVSPSLLRWSHGGATLDLDEPMPTIATERGGVFSQSSPYLCPLYNPRPNQRPRTREIDRPLMTVPASKPSPAMLATPFIEDCQGPAKPVDAPLNTQPASDRYALCIPRLYPYGLDISYRMLQPDELAKAQGFPSDYEIAGTKSDKTTQIGNAVPVNTAKSLCKHVLTAGKPSLATYGGGISEDEDCTVPEYSEVIADGGTEQATE